MAEIDLIHDADCPNANQARINLRRALEIAGLPARWREWIRTATTTPQDLRRFGSPTILVDGRDVAGLEPLDGTGACRIYQGENLQYQGVPAVSTILAALHGKPGESVTPRPKAGLLSSMAVVPGTLAAFLPALSCPACWPAYAGLLSSLGIGFLWKGPYLLPITVVLLGIALVALAHGARQRRGYGPLALGTIGSITVLLAKFFLERPWSANVAAGLILAACVWNAWPKKMARRSCPACESESRGAAAAFSAKGETS
jgi:mercuric ion transport protein